MTFDTIKLGDSEIDYTTLGTTYDITLNNILRAKADQPEVKTVLLPLQTDTEDTAAVGIPTLSPIELNTVFNVPEIGFFVSGGTVTGYTIQDSTDYVLQEGTISLSGLTGYSTTVSVIAPVLFSANTYEPQVGDLMMVKMSNDELTLSQMEGVVDINIPVPYLWFKIQSKSGTMSASTLSVTLDRTFPYFDGYAGANVAEVTFYPSGDQFVEGGKYSGGTVWNQNNVWSRDLAGVDTSTYEAFSEYGSENYIGSKEYFGYTSEITDPCDTIRSIGIIHYTNPQSCSNQSELLYGQKFHIDIDNDLAPVLKVPTLMWHGYSATTSGASITIGQEFTATGSESYVTLNGVDTDVRYFNLIDEANRFTVGRVFPDQHVITVDDQELVAALSYKSNRNWTLPTLDYGLVSSNDGLLGQTQDLYVSYLFVSNSGYTTGVHAQNYTCVVVSEEECPDNAKKDVEVFFPTGQLPYMNSGLSGSTLSGGTGWYADELYILAQRVTSGDLPQASDWKIIDYTSSIDSHTVGNRIDPINIENTTFTITKALYSAAPTYVLHDYINIPIIAETDLLQFGDEQFFYGNLGAYGITTKYRTKFNITVPPNQFNTSTNPTWAGSGQNVHISEIGIYSNNGELVASGKMNLPIEKSNSTTTIIEIAFDL